MIQHAPPTQGNWWRRLCVIILRSLRGVLFLEDTAPRIARGSAAGIFSSTLPIFGQTFFGMILARILRGNIFASIPWSWLSNPLTTLPIWYGSYRLGIWLMPDDRPVLSYADLMALLDRFNQTNFSDGLSAMVSMLGGILGPLWLGCVILGLTMALPGYFMIHAAVIALQARRIKKQGLWRKEHSHEHQ